MHPASKKRERRPPHDGDCFSSPPNDRNVYEHVYVEKIHVHVFLCAYIELVLPFEEKHGTA